MVWIGEVIKGESGNSELKKVVKIEGDLTFNLKTHNIVRETQSFFRIR